MENSLRTSIRLSKRADIDLIALAQSSISVQQTVTQAILAQINGTEYLISPQRVTAFEKKPMRIMFHFKDFAVIQWLNAIPPGMRSTVIKSILRKSISDPTFYFSAEMANVQPVHHSDHSPSLFVPPAKPLAKTKKEALVQTPQEKPKPIIHKPEPVAPATTTKTNDGDDLFDFI